MLIINWNNWNNWNALPRFEFSYIAFQSRTDCLTSRRGIVWRCTFFDYCTICSQVLQSCGEMVLSVHKQYNLAKRIVSSVHKQCNLAVRLYQVYTGSTILRRDCTKCTQAVQSCREMVSSVHGQYNIAAEIVPSVHKQCNNVVRWYYLSATSTVNVIEH